jgi:fatty-acyl-CoA synthase
VSAIRETSRAFEATADAALRPAKAKEEPNALAHWVRALSNKQAMESGEVRTLLALVEGQREARGADLALRDEAESVSYAELVLRARDYGAWAQAQGLKPGDVVCLIMPNCADYVAIWLGLTHLGCVTSLINTNLVGAGLVHCIRTSRPRLVLAGATLLSRVNAVLDDLEPAMGLWVHDDGLSCVRPERAAAGSEASGGCDEAVTPTLADPALLIFTSGTTGFPKAAYVTHGRILEWSGWFAGMMDAQREDRLFNCLPMYHSVGGVVAVGAMLFAGAAVVIRQHFSVTRFWRDIVQNDCTIFQYIGELCRYLTRGPEVAEAKSHRLRLCCGNGLRAEVWAEFQSRFAVPRVLEYYAATEGNVSLFNCEGKLGAIGRIPPVLAHRFPVTLIKLDEDSGLPLRDAAGFCLRCAPDEPGEAIGRIEAGSRSASRRFDGYTDAEASSSKVLRNVFAEGDCWFRTGDLMRRDRQGYFYFVDRLGGSFRWKGENVSATEVASVIMQCPEVLDAVVFGVRVRGTEGRAGMAALAVGAGFRADTLTAHLAAHLPPFARPVFIRLCASIPSTGTFKLRQEDLAREGLAVRSQTGSLWFHELGSGGLLPCTDELLDNIASGAIRL